MIFFILFIYNIKDMLYIRHGQKSYRNGKSEKFSLDPDLTIEGKFLAKSKFQQLVKHHGIPIKIISSPYLRTRETSEIAQYVIFEMTGQLIEIVCDNMIGEFLGKQYNKKLSEYLRPETLAYNPIPSEYINEYETRIYKHIKSAATNTWYITHGLNIKSIAACIGQKINYPHELCGIRIDENKITFI